MDAEPGFNILVKKNASVDDTLQLIIDTINKFYSDAFVTGVYQALNKQTPADTDRTGFLHNLFDFYCRNIDYLLDTPAIEEVHTPALTMVNGTGDCKKCSIFLASVLKRAGIEPVLKHVYYDGNGSYTHIYVIVPIDGNVDNYVTLDPTNNCRYDTEVKYKSATLYFLNGTKMELRQMGRTFSEHTPSSMIPFSGEIAEASNDMLGDLDDLSRNTIGATTAPHLSNLSTAVKASPIHAALQKQLAAGKSIHESIVSALTTNAKAQAAVKNIPIDQQRQSLITLIENNVNGMASNLVQVLAKKPDALDPIWAIVGGDLASLKLSVLAGAKKPVTIEGPEYISGAFSKFLHGAVALLKAVAPIANMIVPGAGAVLTNIANKAQAVADALPPNAPPPTLPGDPHGAKIPLHGGVHGGSVMGSVGGFIFKSILLINLYIPHNLTLAGSLGIVAFAAPLIYIGFKKLNQWQTSKNI